MSCSHFSWRRMTRNTLPFAGGHLHPRVGPPFIIIKRLSHGSGTIAFEAYSSDSRIAEYRYLHIVVVSAVPFSAFVKCKCPSLVADFAIGLRHHDLVGPQRRDEIRIICLLPLKPLLLQCRDSFFGGATTLRRCDTDQ